MFPALCPMLIKFRFSVHRNLKKGNYPKTLILQIKKKIFKDAEKV